MHLIFILEQNFYKNFETSGINYPLITFFPTPGSAPFYKILVPTVDTLRYDFIVHHLIMVERPVLLVGPVGTGKTSVAQGVLQKLDPQKFNLLTINLSAQVGMQWWGTCTYS